MPRLKRRTLTRRSLNHDALEQLLTGDRLIRIVMLERDELSALWDQHGDWLLERFAELWPTMKPWAWWQFDPAARMYHANTEPDRSDVRAAIKQGAFDV